MGLSVEADESRPEGGCDQWCGRGGYGRAPAFAESYDHLAD